MKKIFAILLALVLTVAMGTAALAEGGTEALNKKYSQTGVNAVAPAATFGFDIKYVGYKVDKTDDGYDATVTANKVPTVSDVEFKDGAGEKVVAISTEDVTYPKVGYYYYTIKEKTPDTPIAGIAYDTHEMMLVVSVMQEAEGFGLTKYIYVMNDKNVKTETFAENVYTAGSLEVTKMVEGSLGDKTATYPVTVTLTSDKAVASTITVGDEGNVTWTQGEDGKYIATISLNLSHNVPVTIGNIPAGVAYTVVEDDANENGYTTTYKGETGTMGAELVKATVTNTKEGAVDTGITMDSIPYVVLLALAVVGLAAVSMKKRYQA